MLRSDQSQNKNRKVKQTLNNEENNENSYIRTDGAPNDYQERVSCLSSIQCIGNENIPVCKSFVSSNHNKEISSLKIVPSVLDEENSVSGNVQNLTFSNENIRYLENDGLSDNHCAAIPNSVNTRSLSNDHKNYSKLLYEDNKVPAVSNRFPSSKNEPLESSSISCVTIQGKQTLNNSQCLEEVRKKLSNLKCHSFDNPGENTPKGECCLNLNEATENLNVHYVDDETLQSPNFINNNITSDCDNSVGSDDDEDDCDNDEDSDIKKCSYYSNEILKNEYGKSSSLQPSRNKNTHASVGLLKEAQLSVDVNEDLANITPSNSQVTILKQCSQVQFGPQLHYHSGVTINQNFKHCKKELLKPENIKRLALTAPLLEVEPYCTDSVSVSVNAEEFNNRSPTSHCEYKKLYNKVLIPGIVSIFIIMTITIALLLTGYKMDGKSSLKEGPFTAVKNGEVDKPQDKKENNNINSLLYQATKKKNLNLVKVLTRQGANLEARQGSTGNMAIHIAAYEGSVDIVKWFLDNGVPGDIRNYYGTTPLHKAAHGNCTNVAKLLLERKVNINVPRTSNNETPLHTVALYDKENMVKFLIENGADVNALTTDNNQTPLHFAVKKGFLNIVKILVSCGSDTTARDKDNKTPLELAISSRNNKKPPKLAKDIVNWLSDVTLGLQGNATEKTECPSSRLKSTPLTPS